MAWKKDLSLNIHIERDDYGYFAECQELEGTQVQGDSLHDLLANLAGSIIAGLQRQSPAEKPSFLKEHADYATSTLARAQLIKAGFISLRKDSKTETLVGNHATINLPVDADKPLHPKLVALIIREIANN